MRMSGDVPDNTDTEIIAALREDPRITNKDVANQIDLAETTVAQRIKLMASRGVMRVIAQQHVFSNGFEVMAFLFAETSGRKVQSIAQEIAGFDDVISIAQGIGNPDIFAHIRSDSLENIHRLSAKIGEIRGVASIEIVICLKVHKYVSTVGELLSHSPVSASTKVGKSERDNAILETLARDGRISNRELARQLDVSEGTIRQRIGSMERAGRMQFGVVCSSTALQIGTLAIMRIRVQQKRKNAVLLRLVDTGAVQLVGEVSGRANLFVLANTRDAQELGDLCDNHIQSIRGVLGVDVQILVAPFKHRYDLTYIFEAE
jgi:DNA-binding Lrp family transcriptional regulator